MQDPSRVCDLHHSSRQRRVLNRVRPGIKPSTSRFLVGLASAAPRREPPFSFFYNPIGPGPRPPLRLHLAHRDEAFRKGSSLRAVAAAPLPSKAPSHQQGRPRSSLPSLLPSPRGSQSSPAYTVSASDLQGDASPAPTPGPAALPSASSARGITGLVVRARGRASRHYNSHGAAGRRSRTNRGGRPPRGGSGLPPRGRGAEMADGVAGKDKCGEPRLVSLPLSRIRVIMKSSPEVSSINQEALVLTAKATELFVQYLATYSYRHGSGREKKALTYSDLSNTAEESETFQFLADILPKKILASKYLKMLKEKRGEEEENDDDDDESDDEAES
uniref:Chromatin accessibility complex protein 1 n=1 Tax=Sus scrofa TaxID=9823 RepID=A0A8D1R0F5_PIG